MISVNLVHNLVRNIVHNIVHNLVHNNIVRVACQWAAKYVVSKPHTLILLYGFECAQLFWPPSWICVHDCKNKHLV